jgi:hypothetical protein
MGIRQRCALKQQGLHILVIEARKDVSYCVAVKPFQNRSLAGFSRESHAQFVRPLADLRVLCSSEVEQGSNPVEARKRGNGLDHFRGRWMREGGIPTAQRCTEQLFGDVAGGFGHSPLQGGGLMIESGVRLLSWRLRSWRLACSQLGR